MEEKKDVRRIIEQSGEYVVHGTAAVKVQTAPQYAPSHKQAPQRKHKRKLAPQTQPKRGLQSLPVLVKAEIVAAIIAVCGIGIVLMAMQANVSKVNAENNAIIRNIDSMQREIEDLREITDKSIDMDEVYAVIESEGLVHADTGVNP